MIIRPLSDIFALIDEDSAHRLEGILSRSIRGSSQDLRSPLYKAAPRREIIDAMTEMIGPFGNAEMDAIDDKELKKIGTFSVRLPFEEIRDTLYAYFDNPNPLGDPKSFRMARERLMSLVPYRSLRSAPLTHAFGKMPKGTNLGCPLFSNEPEDAYVYLERARTIKSASEIYPFVLFWRGQANGTPIPKQRHVCGGDHVDTILWESLLIPLLETLRRMPGFAAWNDISYIDETMTELLQFADRLNTVVISGDFKNFDTTLSSHIINTCFDCCESWFQKNDSRIINILREEFLTTGVICPDGVLSDRNGAVMSGSGGTNIIDSLANLFAAEYVSARTGVDLRRCEVMGDDSVSVYELDLSQDLEEIMAEIGLVASSDKQFISARSCHYLQRWHSLDYTIDGVSHGVRSPYRFLSGAMSYETLRGGWNKFMDSTRWVMQLEQCRWDKRFKSLVAFVKEGDSVLRSGMDPVDVFKAAGGPSQIRKVMRIESFPFNVKEPEGVAAFATTSVLRAL